MSNKYPRYFEVPLGDPSQKSPPPPIANLELLEERYHSLKDENADLKQQVQKLMTSLLETTTKLDSLTRNFDSLTNDLNRDIPSIWEAIRVPKNLKFGPYSIEEIVEKYPELGHIDFTTKNQEFKTNMCTRDKRTCGYLMWGNGTVVRDDCMYAHSYEQLGYFTEGKKWRARNGQKTKKQKTF